MISQFTFFFSKNIAYWLFVCALLAKAINLIRKFAMCFFPCVNILMCHSASASFVLLLYINIVLLQKHSNLGYHLVHLFCWVSIMQILLQFLLKIYLIFWWSSHWCLLSCWLLSRALLLSTNLWTFFCLHWTILVLGPLTCGLLLLLVLILMPSWLLVLVYLLVFQTYFSLFFY